MYGEKIVYLYTQLVKIHGERTYIVYLQLLKSLRVKKLVSVKRIKSLLAGVSKKFLKVFNKPTPDRS